MSFDWTLLKGIPLSRRLKLSGYISEKVAKNFNSRMKRLCRSPMPAMILFNSSGGDTRACLSIYETILACGPERIFGVVDKAQSGALIALQACGQRIGRARSKYVAHSNRRLSGLEIVAYGAKEAYLEEAAREWDTGEFVLRRMWEKSGHAILLGRVEQAGRTEADLIRLYSENRIMGADEALEWNFIDLIRPARKRNKAP